MDPSRLEQTYLTQAVIYFSPNMDMEYWALSGGISNIPICRTFTVSFEPLQAVYT